MYAFTDVMEGLLRGGVPLWPALEVVQKLYKSIHQQSYRGEDLKAVSERLGYYCDLQSVHSEDAITWNVFGPIVYATEETRIAFCTKLFSLIDPSLRPPNSATISLWRRVPHPDTFGSGGPEIDVFLQTPEVVVVGEAKWLSSVGSGQGVNKNKDQITLRKEFFEKLGQNIYSTGTMFVILGISFDDMDMDTYTSDDKVLFRNVFWEDVCNIKPHPAAAELPKYYQWKKDNSVRGTSAFVKALVRDELDSAPGD